MAPKSEDDQFDGGDEWRAPEEDEDSDTVTPEQPEREVCDDAPSIADLEAMFKLD